METSISYTTVDRVLAKFHRDLRGTDINESDAIEWIGEALGLLYTPQIQEEAIAFIEVKNYEADVPKYMKYVIQIARKNNYTPGTNNISDFICNCNKENQTCNCNDGCDPCNPCKTCESCSEPIVYDCIKDIPSDSGFKFPVPTDCLGHLLYEEDYAYYRPKFDLKWEYDQWQKSEYYRRDFSPVKLSNHTFFNSIVCKEGKDLYSSVIDEYTIIGNVCQKFRFSFKEGLVAVAYLKTALDKETGYPLVPDHESYMAAITYYLKWKIAEYHQWNGREGAMQLAQDSERKWLKYCRQAKNYSKMPKTIDHYQNMMEQTYIIPNVYKYYNFFGNYTR